ncbi:MAG: uncharacterized protein KVP18_003823 [Porospora cf. gigantea A]|uniref:uncharacterized protein n=1 Tax=Porospora cf. gigantea A TaxID=2853593 RepID=UPI00355A8D8D|nr:MAG: hypothetical protein KVP18_003823 [Porospora cf. gigantea A]
MTFKIPEIPPLPLHLVERCLEPIPTYNRLPVDEDFESSEETSSEICSDDDFISTGLPESYRHTHRRVATSRLPREEDAKRRHAFLSGMQTTQSGRCCMTTRPHKPRSAASSSVVSLQSAETPGSSATPASPSEDLATPISEAPFLTMEKQVARLSRFRRMIRRVKSIVRRIMRRSSQK